MKETKSKDIEVPVLSKKELHLIDKEIRWVFVIHAIVLYVSPYYPIYLISR
jgi:hypothetical protein